MEEARSITNGQYQIPSIQDLKQQDDYTIGELATIVYKEFPHVLAGKKRRKQLERRGRIPRQQ